MSVWPGEEETDGNKDDRALRRLGEEGNGTGEGE